jgi:hypothetical protein
MRKVFVAFACAVSALAIAGPAGAGVSVGVNDDAGKYADGAPQFWQTMAQNKLKQNAVTVLWDETQPTSILDQSFITKAIPVAAASGIKIVLDVYPMHSQAMTSDPANIQRFGAFLTKLAQTFPTVTEYVVMNECNQPRFMNPQFNGSGVNQSAAICGQALAAGYDALKAVNPSIFVWGVGLSPRGNDTPNASSNISTSPVKFLGALGQWYRSSGRTKPIMDGFDFHPYPIPQSLPFATGYANQSNNAAVSNLPRIYQAFYDAFKGTAQPAIGQQAGGNLPVSLNEVGIQTDNTGKAGYTGVESAANDAGGVRGDTATESFQSNWYVQMLNLVACDPNVKVVNLFHLVDESDLGGWQSGLYYVGYSAKASAGAVSGWIAQTGGNCTGTSKPWTPNGVLAPPPTTTTPPVTTGPVQTLASGQLGQLFRGQLLPAVQFGSTLSAVVNGIGKQLGKAKQDTTVTLNLLFIGSNSTSSARGLSSASAKPVASAQVLVKKGHKLKIALRFKQLTAGYYKLRYDLKAVTGAAKATITTTSFYLLGDGKLRK